MTEVKDTFVHTQMGANYKLSREISPALSFSDFSIENQLIFLLLNVSCRRNLQVRVLLREARRLCCPRHPWGGHQEAYGSKKWDHSRGLWVLSWLLPVQEVCLPAARVEWAGLLQGSILINDPKSYHLLCSWVKKRNLPNPFPTSAPWPRRMPPRSWIPCACNDNDLFDN